DPSDLYPLSLHDALPICRRTSRKRSFSVAIDRAQVRHVARLARLALSPEEEERFAAQLGHVLEYIERLSAVDVSGVEPLSFAGEDRKSTRLNSSHVKISY